MDSAVVYNGQGMPLPVTKREGAQHKYPLQLVWTGRITRRKRLEVILSWVHDSDLVSIEVVGNGKLYQELFEKYGGYSNINFLRTTENLYRRRSCFLYVIRYIQLKFRGYKLGVVSFDQIILSSFAMSVSVLMPNNIRKILYDKILHKRN